MKRDLRNYAKQTTFRLLVGALILLFIIGDGLIFILYGSQAAVFGLTCLGLGLLPIALILIIFWIIEWIINHANQE